MATSALGYAADWADPTEASWLNLGGPPLSTDGKNLLPTPGKNQQPIPIYKKMTQNIKQLFGIAPLAILIFMMPGMVADSNNFNYRTPPSWSPSGDQLDGV